MDSPQQICEQYPAFVEKVFNMAEGQDLTLFGVAADTVGILGSNVEGKLVLQKTGSSGGRGSKCKSGYRSGGRGCFDVPSQEQSLLFAFPGSRFHRVLNRIGHQIKNAPTELRIRCLDVVSSLLYLQVSYRHLPSHPRSPSRSLPPGGRDLICHPA